MQFEITCFLKRPLLFSFTPSHLNRVHLCQGTTFSVFEGFTDAGLIQDHTAEYSGVTGLVTCVTSSLSRNRLRRHFSNNISQLGTWVGPGFVFVLHIVLHSDFD